MQTKADGGTVVAWGSNSQGQANVPLELTNVVGIAGGSTFTVALKSDGKVVCWGSGTQTNPPSGLSNVIAIAAGTSYSLALKSNGKVIGWGSSSATNPPADLGNVVAMAAGTARSLALKSDGIVVGWGIPAPSGLSNVVAIAAGQSHFLALKGEGTVVGWGQNSNGQTNVPVGLSNVVAIAAGGNASLALKSDGSVVGWGKPPGVPVGLTNVTAIAAGSDHRLALKQDRTVVAWGTGSPTNVPVSLSNVLAIAAGDNHSLALVGENPFAVMGLPVNIGAIIGGPAFFNIRVSGSPPFNYQWRFGGTNIIGATNSWLLLTDVQSSHEGSYDLVVGDASNTATNSNATLDVVTDLGEALNNTNLVWTHTENPPWLPQTGVTHDGLAAATTTATVSGQAASLQTMVTGPGTLSFWWQTTDITFSGLFSFRMDQTNLLTFIAIPTSWQQKTFYIPFGTHALEWRASQSFSPLNVYLDQVSFVPGPPQFGVVSESSWTNGGFRLQLSGLSGHGEIVIRASSNLVNWEPILTNPPVIGTLQFLDTQAINQPVRFYQAEEK